MKIYLASDHAGFELKGVVKKYLEEKGYQVEDSGAFSFDKNDDYPDFIQKAALQTSKENGIGIVFGKSGAGECIVANKIKGIRAILGFSKDNVKLSREHNDANVLSLGSQFVDENLAKELVDIFLSTPFSKEERHIRRVERIKKIEESL
ncbi:MAG: ribose-5-phosphate isomerase [Candidatus Levybacteria bacterium CG10_big_fil_rev_8_21_14_0_10_36_7]|nr:MAG: ribose-5-phosphate isomerase [Candidatus Levybacteria bacterium CG10_big_fil_rev_8_21_14_0_10_36_7]